MQTDGGNSKRLTKAEAQAQGRKALSTGGERLTKAEAHGGWLHANLRTENSESQSVDLLLIEKRACMGSLSSLDFVPGPDLGMRCCLAGWRSQRRSCEQLIGADETNPSRGPRPPESKKNGRAVL